MLIRASGQENNGMKTYIAAMLLVLLAGCFPTPGVYSPPGPLPAAQANVPVNISEVRTEQELDKYVGERVTFTGKWQNSKESGISNGHVFISPDLAFWGGCHGYEIGDTETVTGCLVKYVVDENKRPSKFNKIAQSPSPGNHYSIVKKWREDLALALPRKEEAAGPLKKKLETIIIDKLEFDEIPMKEVFNYLGRKSKELDPDKKGVNFILHEARSDSGAIVGEPAVSMLLDNGIPLLDAIKYICRNSNAKFTVDENANAVIIELQGK